MSTPRNDDADETASHLFTLWRSTKEEPTPNIDTAFPNLFSGSLYAFGVTVNSFPTQLCVLRPYFAYVLSSKLLDGD